MLDLQQVGAALREIREMARLKQRDVAAHLGVSDGAVSQWERGQVELKPSQIQAIAELVGLDFDAALFKLGYRVSDEARERYAGWLLARFAQPGAPAPVSRQKPWGDIGRTSRSNVPQDDQGGSSQVRYRDLHIPGVFSHAESALVGSTL